MSNVNPEQSLFQIKTKATAGSFCSTLFLIFAGNCRRLKLVVSICEPVCIVIRSRSLTHGLFTDSKGKNVKFPMRNCFVIVQGTFLSTCSIIQYRLNDLLIFIFRKNLDPPCLAWSLTFSLISSKYFTCPLGRTSTPFKHCSHMSQLAAKETADQGNH